MKYNLTEMSGDWEVVQKNPQRQLQNEGKQLQRGKESLKRDNKQKTIIRN